MNNMREMWGVRTTDIIPLVVRATGLIKNKIAFSRRHTARLAFQLFLSYDLDLDPMTLILELDLDIVKMYLYAKKEVSMSSHSKVRARTVTHTFLGPVTLNLTP